MKKYLRVSAAAAALVLSCVSSGVVAAPPEEHRDHEQFSAEDRAAFTDARIAGMKAGLKLTPAQEKNWPALETALRDAANARAARAAEWRENAADGWREHGNVVEAVKDRAKHLASRAAELEKIAEAAKPLYESLDDAQKRRFGVLLHIVARGRGHCS